MKLFNIFAVVAGTMVAYSQAITIRAIQGDGDAAAGGDAATGGEADAALVPGVVDAIFTIGDSDKSGVIDRNEFRDMVKGMREIFAAADKVGGTCPDGDVSKEDLTTAILAEMAKDHSAGGDDSAGGDAAKTD